MDDFPFASRYLEPAGSPIRELFQYLSKPGIVSFAGGYPSPSLLDVEGIRDAALRALAEGSKGLEYGATEGMPALREALAGLCGTRGVRCSASDVLVTTGSQQAFDLLVRIFVDPGDPIYVETPAYPAAIQALRLAGARIHEVPVDADGLQTDALEAMLKAADPAELPKLLYTVPTFSNPCGSLLLQARREALVRLAITYRFLIVEDDPYGELTFTDEKIEPLHAVGLRLAGAANPVIYLASLSKTVAPALRIGWMVAPQPILRRCVVAKQTVDLCTSPLAQSIAAAYLRSGRYPVAVMRAAAEYAKRMSALAGALDDELGGTLCFSKPKGGMFLWAAYTETLDHDRLFHSAVDRGVVYVPGAAFYPNTPQRNRMRLSYAAPSVEEIKAGVRRLAEAFRSL